MFGRWHGDCDVQIMSVLDHQNTQVLAHYIFKLEGSPQGQRIKHWLEAQRMLTENIFGEPPKKARYGLTEFPANVSLQVIAEYPLRPSEEN